MPFSFEAPEYNFYFKKTPEEIEELKNIYQQGVQEGWTRAEMIREVRQRGLGYRTKEMLEDINRAYAIEQSKTEEAYDRANRWFYNLKRVKQEFGFRTYSEAADFMQRWKTESFETVEEAEKANELEEIGICASPPC